MRGYSVISGIDGAWAVHLTETGFDSELFRPQATGEYILREVTSPTPPWICLRKQLD